MPYTQHIHAYTQHIHTYTHTYTHTHIHSSGLLGGWALSNMMGTVRVLSARDDALLCVRHPLSPVDWHTDAADGNDYGGDFGGDSAADVGL
jgi:hypothetical protein